MYVCPSVARLSVRMEQLSCHWTDFLEIWYLGIFRKSSEKIQVSLKSDKNNGNFTWRSINILDHISFISSKNEKCFRQKSYRKSKHTFLLNIFFENCAFYEIMWKNMYSGAGQRWQYGACTLHAGYSKYVIFLLLHCNNGCTNEPKCYVTYIACPVSHCTWLNFLMPVHNPFTFLLRWFTIAATTFFINEGC